MKFYRHYKNKLYKYLGTAKHSETLEDLAVYEALYENELGSLWVRPKEMFFENVFVEGMGSVPRFRKVELKFETREVVGPKDFELIALIGREVFAEWEDAVFREKLSRRQGTRLQFAFVDGDPAAFKLAYTESPGILNSWMGGVRPKYRRTGLARSLMAAQHEWAMANGYTKIRTKTGNRFPAMLRLNVESGFQIYDLDREDPRGLGILMEKNLKEN